MKKTKNQLANLLSSKQKSKLNKINKLSEPERSRKTIKYFNLLLKKINKMVYLKPLFYKNVYKTVLLIKNEIKSERSFLKCQ